MKIAFSLDEFILKDYSRKSNNGLDITADLEAQTPRLIAVISELLVKFDIYRFFDGRLRDIDNCAYDFIDCLKVIFWHYLDVCVAEDPTLFKFGISMRFFVWFITQKFGVFSLLDIDYDYCEELYMHIIHSWDIAGVFMINKSRDKVLCLYNKDGLIDFAKGKIDPGESTLDCAIRETYEETGYDISGKIREDQAFTFRSYFYKTNPINPKFKVAQKNITMYMIYDVEENFPFKCQTSIYEAARFEWVPVTDFTKKCTGTCGLISSTVASSTTNNSVYVPPHKKDRLVTTTSPTNDAISNSKINKAHSRKLPFVFRFMAQRLEDYVAQFYNTTCNFD